MEHDVREDIFMISRHSLPLLPLSRGGGADALGRARTIGRHFYTAKPVITAFYLSTKTTKKKNLLYGDMEETTSLEI